MVAREPDQVARPADCPWDSVRVSAAVGVLGNSTIMHNPSIQPTRADLERVFRAKHGNLAKTGWSPRTRFRYGYFTPDDHYEAVVANLVKDGCAWIDVGGGRTIFPDNQALAQVLTERSALVVGVDPSDTVNENQLVHRRTVSTIEDYVSEQRFDLATLRMVAEHIEKPDAAVASLARLVRPAGKVVVYTINQWSPVSIASWITPFSLHHPIKRLLWNTEEKDTFPVSYKMNSRKQLSALFQRHGFKECYFTYLDDCRTFHCFRVLSTFELCLWRLLAALGINYPENCLLAVYERTSANTLLHARPES
jgi:2-polyprenyl-3-methyl-5-hydroxy-6-metoxy-1,4-benzoquinol methylase